MKPVNSKEIQHAYQRFVLMFTLLLVFSISCFFLYLKAADREYIMLRKEYEEVENLMNSRVEINRQFAEINRNFKEIGQGNADLSAIGRKRILQNEIAKNSGRVDQIMAELKSDTSRASLKLYSKLNRDVTVISRLQDSLFSSKNLIESKRMQLQSCIEMNKKINKVVGRGSMVGR